MNFDPKFISLIKGLVINVVSKVHVNGGFTTEIPLERRVRQGCPAASLLFALATQPLMCLLEAKLESGELHGINTGSGKKLLHQLFNR